MPQALTKRKDRLCGGSVSVFKQGKCGLLFFGFPLPPFIRTIWVCHHLISTRRRRRHLRRRTTLRGAAHMGVITGRRLAAVAVVASVVAFDNRESRNDIFPPAMASATSPFPQTTRNACPDCPSGYVCEGCLQSKCTCHPHHGDCSGCFLVVPMGCLHCGCSIFSHLRLPTPSLRPTVTSSRPAP